MCCGGSVPSSSGCPSLTKTEREREGSSLRKRSVVRVPASLRSMGNVVWRGHGEMRGGDMNPSISLQMNDIYIFLHRKMIFFLYYKNKHNMLHDI